VRISTPRPVRPAGLGSPLGQNLMGRKPGKPSSSDPAIERTHMREMFRRDGSTAIFDDNDPGDLVIIEPVVANFVPTNGNARCICGAPLRSWSWRMADVSTVEIGCSRCHRVLGHFQLGTKVHR
jgi:hypothetical protein